MHSYGIAACQTINEIDKIKFTVLVFFSLLIMERSRVVDGDGLENRVRKHRGFESLSLRQRKAQ